MSGRVLLRFDLGVAQLTDDALPSGWSALEPQIAAIPPGAVAVPSELPRHRRAFDVAGGMNVGRLWHGTAEIAGQVEPVHLSYFWFFSAFAGAIDKDCDSQARNKE